MTRLSILVPFRSDDGPRERVFNWVWDRLSALFPNAEIVICDDGSAVFSRAGSRNKAARSATGDVFLFVDADTVFRRDQIERGLGLLADGAPWVIPYGVHEYYNLTHSTSEELLAQPPDCELPTPTEWDHRVESWAGALLVPRAAFELVYGYDERFAGWGGEDNAFRFALDAVVGSYERLAFENVQHIWHPRGADFASSEWPANRRLMKRYQTTSSRDEMLALCREHSSYSI